MQALLLKVVEIPKGKSTAMNNIDFLCTLPIGIRLSIALFIQGSDISSFCSVGSTSLVGCEVVLLILTQGTFVTFIEVPMLMVVEDDDGSQI